MSTTHSNRGDQLAGLFLLLFAAALPHSIAAAQVAASGAVLAWLAGCVVGWKRPTGTPLDLPVFLFLLVSALAAMFSLEPMVSVPKLASTSLVLILWVTASVVRTTRQAILLILVLLGSACGSAGVVVWGKAVGRGVDVVSVSANSPLAPFVQPRDVILSCDGQQIKSPAHFRRLLSQHNPSLPLPCRAMRSGILPYEFEIPVEHLPQSGTPLAWNYEVKVGRGLRARGTYGHFVTYAEVMLQLSALAGGLCLAYPWKPRATGVALPVAALLLTAALAATFTRASLAALLVAWLVMVGMKVGWRGRLATALAVTVGLVGLNALLVQWRGVGFYNPADLSMQYRRMMWEDGWRLLGEHPWLGVGMDTVLSRWRELGIRAYERFGLHSHFHSTPVQLAVERGLLGLAAWGLLMGLYARLLLRLVARARNSADKWSHGVALGILGATAGFLASGLVHYNFGDSEIVMVFWLLAGVAVALDRSKPSESPPPPSL